MRAVVEPGRARSDTRYLWPDLRRPGFAMRLPDDPGVASASADPSSVCERGERELAATAWRYRRVLVSGLAAIVMPLLWSVAAWWSGAVVPPMWHLAFERGILFPGPSPYELTAFMLLAVILAWGQWPFGEGWRSFRRLGTDLRRLRDAQDEVRREIAREAASGRWPRVAALLTRAREFAGYAAEIAEVRRS